MRFSGMVALALFLAAPALVSISLADVVILKNGSRIEGTVKKTDAGYEVTGSDGKVTKVPVANVKSIELGKASDASSADASLKSLRRSTDALGDINQIIDRYQRFIDATKDAKVQADARADLATWKDRRDRGLIKHGTKWVTPAEAADLIAKADATAEEARSLLRGGKQPEAEAAVRDALAQDPANVGALYLRGIILYRADKLADARKAFEAVNSQIVKHAPTLNNLAVILWRQNQAGGSLNFYDQAMQAAPVNKYVLDNVADALGTLPPEQRKGNQIQRVMRRFAEQDLLLQKQMSPQGWFRWGSTWIDQKTLDELRQQEKSVRDKMGAMQSDFDQANQRIAQIDQEVADNTRQMQDMQAHSVFRDKDGNLMTYPLPPAYYEYQRKNQDLRNEQSSLKTKLDTLRDQAKHIEESLPHPRFTGVQQIVGVEGMPVTTLQSNAATQPTTAPN